MGMLGANLPESAKYHHNPEWNDADKPPPPPRAAETATTSATEDALPDFAALAERARAIAEAAKKATPKVDREASRAKLLAADERWGVGVAADGRAYYFEKATQSTQWRTPGALKGARARVVMGERTTKPSPPPPWKAIVDAKSGRTYYWDASSGETTWTIPEKTGCAPAVRVIPARPPPPTPTPAEDGVDAEENHQLLVY